MNKRTWHSWRVRRTWVQVRASGTAVQKMVFGMRLKAAIAQKVVAKRRRAEAADILTAVLREVRCKLLLFMLEISPLIRCLINCRENVWRKIGAPSVVLNTLPSITIRRSTPGAKYCLMKSSQRSSPVVRTKDIPRHLGVLTKVG